MQTRRKCLFLPSTSSASFSKIAVYPCFESVSYVHSQNFIFVFDTIFMNGMKDFKKEGNLSLNMYKDWIV